MESIPSRPFDFVTASRFRSKLSETFSRAVYGSQLVVVTRRGSRIAGIVSFDDLVFLERMKRRRAQVLRTPVSGGPGDIGPALAERLRLEMMFL